MVERQKRRIEHYLMNADRFIWGLGPGNQRQNYAWLVKEGFKFTRTNYGLVIQQLIRYPGIIEILNKLIIPTVKAIFPEPTINVLREHWLRGERPSLSTLNSLDIKGKEPPGPDRAFHWRPFIEISTQFHYVERWGELAGIWFEEIEHLVNSS